MNKIFILGPGPSCLTPENIKTITKVKNSNIPIFAFQKTFPYCVDYFGITPDYWTYYDPNGSIPGLRYISNNPDIKTNVILPSTVDGEDIEQFKRYCPTGGSTSLESTPRGWSEYCDLLSRVKNRNNIQYVEADTIFRVEKEDKQKFKSVNGNLEHSLRLGKVFFGTSIDFSLPNVGAENKLSMAVLPVVRHLGFTEIYVIGFDGLSGRFYQHMEPTDSRTKSYVGQYRYLDVWKNNQNKINLKIYSLNPNCSIVKRAGIEYVDVDRIL
tara:strand:+ start:1139 stop:1945 length:807 start_codon:yes stop_codon:yes gene_type:complete